MSFGETVLLGALAGFTIYLGLPLGRVQLVSNRARVALAMFSVGVLAFLFGEILVHGVELVEHPVEELGEGEGGSWGEVIGLSLLLGVGFTAGCAGLAVAERWMRPTQKPPPIAGGATDAITVEQAASVTGPEATRAHAMRIGMTIAAAIGLHNFAEGLAIGVSASSGEIGLAGRAAGGRQPRAERGRQIGPRAPRSGYRGEDRRRLSRHLARVPPRRGPLGMGGRKAVRAGRGLA